MKLIPGIKTNHVAGDYIAVPTGEAAEIFSGIIRTNETANFIIDRLQQETTEEEILAALLGEYEVDEAKALADIRKVLDTLRTQGLLLE